jgi:hypothetical protein
MWAWVACAGTLLLVHHAFERNSHCDDDQWRYLMVGRKVEEEENPPYPE